jgi:hypothetical protein
MKQAETLPFFLKIPPQDRNFFRQACVYIDETIAEAGKSCLCPGAQKQHWLWAGLTIAYNANNSPPGLFAG